MGAPPRKVIVSGRSTSIFGGPTEQIVDPTSNAARVTLYDTSGNPVGIGVALMPVDVNQTQINGVAVDVNSGNKSAGTQRVVIATDQPSLSNAIPISAASLPLPSGASTEATLALIKAKTDNIDVLLSTRTKPADQQHVIIDSSASIAVTGTFFQSTQPVSIAGTVTVDTELPAAVVLGDALSNPTSPLVGACLLVYDTSSGQWERLQGNGTNIDGVLNSAIGSLNARAFVYETNLSGNLDRVKHSFGQTTTGIVANGAGTAINMTTTPMSKFTIIVDRTAGSTNTVEINLEGSYDGVIWPGTNQSIIQILSLAVEPAMVRDGVSGPFNYIRYNVVTIGAGNTVTIQLLATR